jgi:hypothetical protein
MSLLRSESFLNNNEEQNPKFLEKRTSILSGKNTPKSKSRSNLELPNPISMNKLNNLNNSFSKLNRLKKNQKPIKSEGNMLKDYLHSHKFGIQRKKSRRITVRPNEMKNKMNANMKKSVLINKNIQENKSMIYYQNEKIQMQKKVQKEIEDQIKEGKPNLNMIENSIILKLNSMRVNYENETEHENDTLNKYFENDLLKTNSIKNNSNKIKININNYFKQKKAIVILIVVSIKLVT